MDTFCLFLSVQDLGGQGIVENSTIGLHRDVGFLQRLSNATGVHIVAGTGTVRALHSGHSGCLVQ